MNRLISPGMNAQCDVSLSGSKYLANRLVIIAALSGGSVELNQVVNNDDINTAIEGLNQLGYQLKREGSQVYSQPRRSTDGASFSVYTAHSGTFSRFVTGVAAFQESPVDIRGSEKMNTRPMDDLFLALRQLGVSITPCDGKEPNEQRSVLKTLPAKIIGPVSHFHCELDGGISSQYVSALLLAAPLSRSDLSIQLVGDVVSSQYIDMTIALMERFGIKVERTDDHHYCVKSGQSYTGGSYVIPPDPVSSSYFMGASAIHGHPLLLNSFDFESLQGEAQFFKVLEAMGCDIQSKPQGLHIQRNKKLIGVDFDMGNMPDVVQTMAAVACFAEGKTVMRNIAHLAYKESNRIVDTARELKKLGATVEFGDDYLTVSNSQLHGAEIETYDDHRMAMSMALIGSKVDNVVIKEANVVSKSFPDYWAKLASIGIHSDVVS